MKLFLVICMIYGIPLLNGNPGNYEQILEPRGITDSFYDWWYGEPENDDNETISQDDRQDTTWQEINKSESQYTEFIPNESGKRVIPVNKITPQRKVEPIEDLLEELNEEIRQSSDNEEKKEIMNTLTEIESNLQEAPSRFVNVMVNKAWRVIDIGNIGSSRRTRGIESIGILSALLQWLYSIFSAFTFQSGSNNSSSSTSASKLPGDQDLYILLFTKVQMRESKDKVDYEVKGDTQDEKIKNIKELLNKKDLSDKTKLLILVELTKMYDDDLDDKTKKRIIYLILVICKAPEFKEILEVIGKSVDAKYEKTRNLFIKERNSLQKKYDDIENSISKDKDKEKDPISKKDADNRSIKHRTVTSDSKNMKSTSAEKVDEKESKDSKDLLNRSKKAHSSKDHGKNIQQPAPKTHERNDSIKKNSPSNASEGKDDSDKITRTVLGKTDIPKTSPSVSPAKVVTDPHPKGDKKSDRSNKKEGSPHISKVEKHDQGNEDPSIKKYRPDIPDHSKNHNNNDVIPPDGNNTSGKSDMVENRDHVVSTSPHNSNKSTSDESSNKPAEPIISQSSNNHEDNYIQTYYPYLETSDRIKFYYDPQEKTYKLRNSAIDLDIVLGKIEYIIKYERHIISQEVGSKIVEDLRDWEHLTTSPQSPLNETVKENLTRIIEELKNTTAN